MARKRNTLFSAVGARITSTFSVTLVLFILGIIALMGVVADNVTREIKGNMGFDITLTDDADEHHLAEVRQYVEGQPYAQEIVEHSASEAAARWQEDTGEDVVELLGVNPFAHELEVRVKPEWANTDSLRAIAQGLEQNEMIREVALQADMIDAVNSNISTIAIALTVIAAALLFISFVLINNTVRLTVYARRFLIHTMRLVGATASFIRRPIIIDNVLQGIIAAFVADILVWLLWAWIASFDPMLSALLSPVEMLWIALSLLGGGMLICFIASFWASNRYISLSYDDMFS